MFFGGERDFALLFYKSITIYPPFMLCYNQDMKLKDLLYRSVSAATIAAALSIAAPTVHAGDEPRNDRHQPAAEQSEDISIIKMWVIDADGNRPSSDSAKIKAVKELQEAMDKIDQAHLDAEYKRSKNNRERLSKDDIRQQFEITSQNLLRGNRGLVHDLQSMDKASARVAAWYVSAGRVSLSDGEAMTHVPQVYLLTVANNSDALERFAAKNQYRSLSNALNLESSMSEPAEISAPVATPVIVAPAATPATPVVAAPAAAPQASSSSVEPLDQVVKLDAAMLKNLAPAMREYLTLEMRASGATDDQIKDPAARNAAVTKILTDGGISAENQAKYLTNDNSKRIALAVVANTDLMIEAAMTADSKGDKVLFKNLKSQVSTVSYVKNFARAFDVVNKIMAPDASASSEEMGGF